MNLPLECVRHFNEQRGPFPKGALCIERYTSATRCARSLVASATSNADGVALGDGTTLRLPRPARLTAAACDAPLAAAAATAALSSLRHNSLEAVASSKHSLQNSEQNGALAALLLRRDGVLLVPLSSAELQLETSSCSHTADLTFTVRSSNRPLDALAGWRILTSSVTCGTALAENAAVVLVQRGDANSNSLSVTVRPTCGCTQARACRRGNSARYHAAWCVHSLTATVAVMALTHARSLLVNDDERRQLLARVQVLTAADTDSFLSPAPAAAPRSPPPSQHKDKRQRTGNAPPPPSAPPSSTPPPAGSASVPEQYAQLAATLTARHPSLLPMRQTAGVWTDAVRQFELIGMPLDVATYDALCVCEGGSEGVCECA